MAVLIIWALPTDASAQFEIIKPSVEQGALEFETVGAVQWGFPNEEEHEEEEHELPVFLEELDFLLPILALKELKHEEEDEEEEEGNLQHGHEFVVGYGVTDFWFSEIAVVFEDLQGESIEPVAIAWENTFDFMPGEAEPFDLGFFLAYEAPLQDDGAHALEFGPVLQVTIGPVVNTANPFFERQFGDHAEPGVAFEYGWQTLVQVDDHFGVGFEAFGEIEDAFDDRPPLHMQDHRIGPVVSTGFELAEHLELEMDLGFLFGLTEESPDYAFKWIVGLETEI